MYTRRHLRVKALQALYAFIQSGNSNLETGRKDLLFSIDKVFDLYLYYLNVYSELVFAAQKLIDEGKAKKLPTPEDLAPNTRFVDNPFFKAVEINKGFREICKKRGITWQSQGDMMKKLFLTIKGSDLYKDYMESPDNSFEAHRNFALEIYRQFISDYEPLSFFFEEQSIYWADDFEVADQMVQKTLKAVKEDGIWELSAMFKDEKDDKDFVQKLFEATVLHEKEFDPLISEKTKNWELERIAFMDVLLMKMALTELITFPTIPVKVSLNEYIELSKSYSTPKSRVFINGILDKIVEDFKAAGKINKTGRGLIENK